MHTLFWFKKNLYSTFSIAKPYGIYYYEKYYTSDEYSSDRLQPRPRVKRITAHYMENNIEHNSFVLREGKYLHTGTKIKSEWPESVNEIKFTITVEKETGKGEYCTSSLHYHQATPQNVAILKITVHSSIVTFFNCEQKRVLQCQN